MDQTIVDVGERPRTPVPASSSTGPHDFDATSTALPTTSTQTSLRINAGRQAPTAPPLSPKDERFYEHSDPLRLEQMKKTEADLREMRKAGGTRRVQVFYREQNELIDELLSPPGLVNEEEAEHKALKLKIAVYGSVAANVMLLGLQLAAAITSGSLSLIATMADSFMDLLSSLILMYAARAAGQKNFYLYPTGKARMETAGIIVFATLMATLSLELMIEAIRTIVSSESSPNIQTLSIIFIAIALGTKLLLYIYCRTMTEFPSAQVLAQDHRNDLFVNSFGLALGILGSKVNRLIDPIGAILVAIIILRSWTRTAYEQVQLIVGKTADPAFLQRITYIALTHHPKITQVDTCRAYHAGTNFFVEVDIVMPPETLLRESHDIGESLQMKLESLPNVERAFVHVDFESDHRPEHNKSQ